MNAMYEAEPQFEFTAALLESDEAAASVMTLTHLPGVDRLEEFVELDEKTNIFGIVRCDVRELADGNVTIQMSLRFPLNAGFHWASNLSDEALSRQWEWFKNTNNVDFGRGDTIETGGTKSLAVALHKETSAEGNVLVLSVYDPQDSSDGRDLGEIIPEEFFSNPLQYREHISSQLHHEVFRYAQSFFDFGKVLYPETYDIVCGFGPLDLAARVDQLGEADRIIFHVPTALSPSGVLDGVVTIRRETNVEEPIVSMYLPLPAEVVAQLGEANVSVQRDRLEAHTQELMKAKISRVDIVKQSGEYVLALTLANGKGDKKNRFIQMIDYDQETGFEHDVVFPLQHFPSVYDWFAASRKTCSAYLDRLGVFLEAPSVNFAETWRVLTTQRDVAYVPEQSSSSEDRIDATVWIDGHTRSFTMHTGLSVVPGEPAREDIWLMNAFAEISRAYPFEDMEFPTNELLLSAWNKYLQQGGRFVNKGVIASRHDKAGVFHVFRLIPRLAFDESTYTHTYTLVAVEEIGDELFDTFAANDFSLYPLEVTLDQIRGHMAQIIGQFESFRDTALEDLVREIRAEAPVTKPWLTEACEHGMFASTCTFTNLRVSVGFENDQLRETVFGYVNFKEMKEIYKVGMLYEPSGGGIDLTIELPIAIKADRAKQAIAELNTLTSDMTLLHSEELLIQGLVKRCVPEFSLKEKEGKDPTVFLRMYLTPTELLALHVLGKKYWDQLIIGEMFAYSRMAIVLWTRRLGQFIL